jgi:hypothetical protein
MNRNRGRPKPGAAVLLFGTELLASSSAKAGALVDQYAAGAVLKEFDLGTVSLPARNTDFVFTSVGKNAASSGFSQTFDYIS